MAEEGKNPVSCALAVGVIALLVLAIGPTTADGAAIVPCPFSPTTSVRLLSVSPPHVLNPCPGGEWAKVFGGYENATAFDVLPTTDGGYAVLGEIRPANRNFEIWLLKLNATGVVEWQYFYGGTGVERPYQIRQTADGGYAVLGWTDSFGAGGVDAWFLKLDASGGIEWQKAYGGAGTDIASGFQLTSDGGYILVGYSNSHNPGKEYWYSIDAWIIKLDSAGNVVWQKAFGRNHTSKGWHECFNSVQQTSDGGYIVAGSGTLWQSGGFVPSTWLVKLNDVGTLVWQKFYGVGSGGQLCGGWNYMANNPDVLITADGGYLVNPVYFYGPEATDGYAMKVDSSGKVQWRMAYGTSLEEWFVSEDVVTSDGGYVFTGLLRDSGGVNHPWVVRTDAGGNVLWQATYGMSVGNANGMAGRVDPSGGIVLAGTWVGRGLTVMKIWGTGNPGACDDLTIGLGSDAVQRSSTVRPTKGTAGATIPSATATNTAATPLASSAQESQLCTS